MIDPLGGPPEPLAQLPPAASPAKPIQILSPRFVPTSLSTATEIAARPMPTAMTVSMSWGHDEGSDPTMRLTYRPFIEGAVSR